MFHESSKVLAILIRPGPPKGRSVVKTKLHWTKITRDGSRWVGARDLSLSGEQRWCVVQKKWGLCIFIEKNDLSPPYDLYF